MWAQPACARYRAYAQRQAPCTTPKLVELMQPMGSPQAKGSPHPKKSQGHGGTLGLVADGEVDHGNVRRLTNDVGPAAGKACTRCRPRIGVGNAGVLLLRVSDKEAPGQ